ncbi:hypothetical protein PIB30_001229 [Stylosanthes scabra]|uniref:Uncharacterized protein n=1 Tax=Stylosanthes scabra TaxID=79078 RepID=A0ABU6W241_9FABA|nr:hypothetical protein [Stylosanthes scabra]
MEEERPMVEGTMASAAAGARAAGVRPEGWGNQIRKVGMRRVCELEKECSNMKKIYLTFSSIPSPSPNYQATVTHGNATHPTTCQQQQ